MRRAAVVTLALTGSVVAGPATANIGVPMVAVFLPPLWWSLLPVIALEAWLLTRLLGLTGKTSVAGVTVGNVLSTLVGIPLVWMVLATIQGIVAGSARGLDTIGHKIYAVTVQAPWLIPYEDDLGWMVPVALLVLAVPAYALSVLIEWRILLYLAGSDDRRATLRAVALANAASYLFLALLFVVVLHFGGLMNPIFQSLSGIVGWCIDSVFFAARYLAGAE